MWMIIGIVLLTVLLVKLFERMGMGGGGSGAGDSSGEGFILGMFD